MLCRESKEFLPKIADVLSQLLQTQDSSELAVIQNSLMSLFRKEAKGIYETLQVLNQTLKFFEIKLSYLMYPSTDYYMQLTITFRNINRIILTNSNRRRYCERKSNKISSDENIHSIYEQLVKTPRNFLGFNDFLNHPTPKYN